jgi:dynein heavy chain
MRDSNLAKFLNEDIPLFNGIVADLFPGVEIVDQKEEYLVTAVTAVATELGLQPTDFIIEKVVQLHDAMRFRHGVMLVGPTCGGKTTAKTILEKTNTLLSQTMDMYHPVNTYTLNPKSLSMAELYGEQNPENQEWVDGLIGILFNDCVEKTEAEEQWIIFDGPVDALWIENMNTVLDDNKLLSLANSKRIKMTQYMHLLFEVQDLAVASPATVSRCAMVFLDPEGLGWRPFAQTAIQTEILPLLACNPALAKRFQDLLEAGVDPGFAFLRENCRNYNRWVPMNLVFSVFNLFTSIVKEVVERGELKFDPVETDVDTLKALSSIFVFSYVWAFGGHIELLQRLPFDSMARDIYVSMVTLPSRGMLFDWCYKVKEREWTHWSDMIPPFSLFPKKAKDDDEPDADEGRPRAIKFHSLLVPTVDTTRFSFLLKTLLKNRCNIFVRGSSGVGKSIIIQRVLKDLDETGQYHLISLVFSAHTSSKASQEMLESKLEKKRGVAIQPPGGKAGVLFIDDLNMPELDRYGSQPPIELLRQLVSMGGLYERPGLGWNDIKNVTFLGAGGPDGGSRAPITARFLRFLFNLELTPPDDNTLYNIFYSILQPIYSKFNEQVQNTVQKIVTASVEVYVAVTQKFLPTPDKSH